MSFFHSTVTQHFLLARFGIGNNFLWGNPHKSTWLTRLHEPPYCTVYSVLVLIAVFGMRILVFGVTAHLSNSVY